MPPYLGVLDCKANELTAPDYCRRDLSSVRFKISPPRDLDDDLTFVLDEEIRFTAKNYWGQVAMFALFADPLSVDPFCRVRIGDDKRILTVMKYEILCLARGMLTFPVHNLPWEDPPDDPEPGPNPLTDRIKKLLRGEQ